PARGARAHRWTPAMRWTRMPQRRRLRHARPGGTMFKHILIATDGSELAGKGLERGLALAKAVGAKVTIATVTEPWSSFEMAYQVRSGNPDPTGQYDKQVAKLAMSVLKEAGQKAEALGVPVATLHIKDMPPAEGIVEAASKN